jgi:hypothetical protein
MQTSFAVECLSQATESVVIDFDMIGTDGADKPSLNLSNFTFRIWAPDMVTEITEFTAPTVTEQSAGSFAATFASDAAVKAFTTANETKRYKVIITHSAISNASARGFVTIKSSVRSEAQFIAAVQSGLATPANILSATVDNIPFSTLLTRLHAILVNGVDIDQNTGVLVFKNNSAANIISQLVSDTARTTTIL